jgi:hypothetical protein
LQTLFPYTTLFRSLEQKRHATDAWNKAITTQEALENFNAASNYAGKPTLTNLQVEWKKARKALLVELRSRPRASERVHCELGDLK